MVAHSSFTFCRRVFRNPPVSSRSSTFTPVGETRHRDPIEMCRLSFCEAVVGNDLIHGGLRVLKAAWSVSPPPGEGGVHPQDSVTLSCANGEGRGASRVPCYVRRRIIGGPFASCAGNQVQVRWSERRCGIS